VPGESGDSTDRDAEILLVGKEAKAAKLPVIVAGDLNDVAWSYTTNLFLKVSELLDPRIGRGFYSTYHAHYKLFRWPLDHVFFSSHFYLHNIKRLPSIGSDHFPIFIEVSLMPIEIQENSKDKKEADKEDLKLAEEKIEEAL
jgi:endonuclease/exonuclease/phosphatase (EEP) superfamily protein YafD